FTARSRTAEASSLSPPSTVEFARRCPHSMAKSVSRSGARLPIELRVTLFLRKSNELAHRKKPYPRRSHRRSRGLQFGAAGSGLYNKRYRSGRRQYGSDHGPLQPSEPPGATALGVLRVRQLHGT